MKHMLRAIALIALAYKWRKVVERVPVTADGVPVAGLDRIYFIHPKVDQIMWCRECEIYLSTNTAFIVYQGVQYRVDAFGYSTREAAEAARKENADGL